ncbi:hypothetical protein Leryth_017773 [Lithospermum erythrorhizon]|nr:hypothetical protein Leryth_017773 [Lithospermum erythrorhizon]
MSRFFGFLRLKNIGKMENLKVLLMCEIFWVFLKAFWVFESVKIGEMKSLKVW